MGRLTIGLHESSTTGVTPSFCTACRNISVHIPGHVSWRGCGYFKDRFPAVNCDPYSVIKALAETCLLKTHHEDDDEGKTMASYKGRKTSKTPQSALTY